MVGGLTIPASQEFRFIYEKSGISMLLEDYLRLMVLLVLTIFVSTTFMPIIMGRLPDLGLPKAAIAGISLSICTSGLASLILLYYPLHKKNQLQKKVDNTLVHYVGYMSVLSAGGIPIERMMERLQEVDGESTFSKLARKFVIDVRLLGLDLSSSLEDTAQKSPSDVLSQLLQSIRNAIMTSGNLKGLLDYELGRLLQAKGERMKKLVGTLTYMGELYVTFIVVGPIIFILLLSMLSVIGGSGSGESAITQLNLLVFFGMPVLAAGFAIVLDATTGWEE